MFPEYRDTPIGLLMEYHNLNRPLDEYAQAQLLIGMCMDNRKHLRNPMLPYNWTRAHGD
ncbi:MAG: carbonic anhydrase [Anaerolineales bacterium]|jgi:carbonic anhydrase|nr:carbonic anhydrase [Anaerolineales bacterium]MBM2850251.1 carbonic anhydrase [Anaerolineales bacterium]